MICNECGTKDYSTSYLDGKHKTVMDECDICFNCAFWTLICRQNRHIIIDGSHYSIGGTGGMAGREFHIRMHDGQVLETTELWHQGTIPEHFRERLPDNANFLNGAGKVGAGDGYCFNSSN